MPQQNQQDNRNNFNPPPDNPIPSPYNFVPLSEKVFFPDWTDKVSMDLPFSDGISGTLQIKLTAKTPIYIRNGGAHEDVSSEEYRSFFRIHPKGDFAIPGSSVKGMLRNVLEIASFGKIAGSRSATSRVDDHRYAVRDLRNQSLYTSRITTSRNGSYEPKVRAGFLKKVDKENWQVSLCEFARVEQEDLEAYHNPARLLLGRKQASRDKYQQWKKPLAISFSLVEQNGQTHMAHRHSCGNLVYKRVDQVGSGAYHGTLVFTGQPSDRKPRGCTDRNSHPCSRGKHMEFIFFGKPENPIPVSIEVKKDFIFAHSELGKNRRPNDEWSFWHPKLQMNEPIPVFMLMDEKTNTISSMGLAMMFRLPYKNSIHQAINHTSADHLETSRIDLAELIFGRVEDQDGLRGRVSIETCIAEGSPTPDSCINTILNGPKPTYYPNYIKQPVKSANTGIVTGNYQTFMDEKCEIRGWKRYIIRPDTTKITPPTPGEKQENVATQFCPLPSGTTFTGTIHVHNLRPQEFGAMLWAITWGGDPSLRHSIGMAKPYGFGSVAISISSANLTWCNPGNTTPLIQQDLIKSFTEMMSNAIPGWISCDQIKALMNVANPRSDWPMDTRYPTLGDGLRTNEFVQFKGDTHGNPKRALLPAYDVKLMKALLPTSARVPVKPAPQPQSPAELFLQQFLKTKAITSANAAFHQISKLGIAPEKLKPDDVAAVYARLIKLPDAKNPNMAAKIERWKPSP